MTFDCVCSGCDSGMVGLPWILAHAYVRSHASCGGVTRVIDHDAALAAAAQVVAEAHRIVGGTP